jgi:hypothetical protein
MLQIRTMVRMLTIKQYVEISVGLFVPCALIVIGTANTQGI